MEPTIMVCNICKKVIQEEAVAKGDPDLPHRQQPFMAPYDEIGVAIMQQHLVSDHKDSLSPNQLESLTGS